MSEQQKVDEDNKNVEDMEGVEGDEGIEDMEGVESNEGVEDMEGVESNEGVEDMEGVENMEVVENMEGVEHIDSIQENKQDAQCEEEKKVKTFNVYHTHRNILKFLCKLFPVIKGDICYWAPEIIVHRIWALSGLNITDLDDEHYISISDEDDILTSDCFLNKRKTIDSFINKHYN